jgi:hypothetical protein
MDLSSGTGVAADRRAAPGHAQRIVGSRGDQRQDRDTIARNERAHQLHYAIKGGVVYVGLEPIPGARGGGKKKTDAFLRRSRRARVRD